MCLSSVEKNNSGFTLVEVIVSSVVALLLLMTVYQLSLGLVKSNHISAQQTQAVDVANSLAEKLQVVKYTKCANAKAMPDGAGGLTKTFTKKSDFDTVVNNMVSIPGFDKTLTSVTYNESDGALTATVDYTVDKTKVNDIGSSSVHYLTAVVKVKPNNPVLDPNSVGVEDSKKQYFWCYDIDIAVSPKSDLSLVYAQFKTSYTY